MCIHEDFYKHKVDREFSPTPIPTSCADNFNNVMFPHLPNPHGNYHERRHFYPEPINAHCYDRYIVIANKTTGATTRKIIGVMARHSRICFDILIDQPFEVGKNDMTKLAFMTVAKGAECGYLLNYSPNGELIDYDMLFLEQAKYVVKRWIKENLLNA
jgi:hypothetical protein